MSDLISRSELLKEIEKYKFGAISNNAEREYVKTTILNFIECQPTAYNIGNVVEELRENASRYTKKYTTPYGNNGYKDTKAISIHKAIEIVKSGSTIYEDVCEWKAIGANDNWSTSCDKNSTHNVFGVAWFKRCPYCGRKLKIVGDNDDD